jgi:hypothetical protein
MRLHRSERLQERWYSLPADVRQFVESLKTDPRPQGALVVEDRVDRFEEFVAGFWLTWEVDNPTGETVIRVTISDS